MNIRLLIYTIGIVFILFMIANIFRTARGDKNEKVHKKYRKKDLDNIEDANFREVKKD